MNLGGFQGRRGLIFLIFIYVIQKNKLWRTAKLAVKIVEQYFHNPDSLLLQLQCTMIRYPSGGLSHFSSSGTSNWMEVPSGYARLTRIVLALHSRCQTFLQIIPCISVKIRLRSQSGEFGNKSGLQGRIGPSSVIQYGMAYHIKNLKTFNPLS